MPNLVIKRNQTGSTSLQNSLDAMLTERKTAEQYTLLLCDVSSSMAEFARGERKIDTLARTVNRLVDEKQCKLIAFESSAKNVPHLPASPHGSTNVAAALRLARKHRKAHQIILISDGYPTIGAADPVGEAFAEARQLTCPFSCIYVGPGEDVGYRFLCELAKLCGGKATYTGEDTGQLPEAIRLMLPK